MHKLTASLAFASFIPTLFIAGVPLVSAQMYTYPYPTTEPAYSTQLSNESCVALTSPLTIGVSDYLVNGQVSELQSFLVREGLLPSTDVTGYFGNLTAAGVAQFQASHGISPVGVVGPETSAAIEQVSCGGVGYVLPSQPVAPEYPVTPANPEYPGYPGGYYYHEQPELNSLAANTNSGQLVLVLQGYDFDPTDNTVHFGTVTIANVASSNNGTELSFNVPTVEPGTYDVYVTTSLGTTNTLAYYVSGNTQNNCSYYDNGSYQNNCNCTYPTPIYNSGSTSNYPGNNCEGQISIASLSETSGYVGSSVTIYGSGFTYNNNTVYFNGYAISNLSSSNDTEITFTTPSVSNTQNGTYSLYVTNGNGQSSNSVQFTVLGNNGYTNGQLYLSSLSPDAGNVGTQVAIEGTGFSPYGNTVYFGNGGAANVESYNNGSVIYFTVPESLSPPCNLRTNNGACPLYEQLVTAGSYPVYVANQNGQTSNTIDFQVY